MRQVLHFGIWPEVNTPADNGVSVTRDMLDAVALVRDAIMQVAPDAHRVIVESPVRIRNVHEQCWGTPDVRVWVQRGERWTLYVVDLKYGFKPVEVFENPQLTLYADGSMDDENFGRGAAQMPPLPPMTEVHFMIVQPRAYHSHGPVRTWRTTADGLRPLVQRLAMAADDAMSPQAQFKPSPSACENCSARRVCPGLQEAGFRLMDVARQGTPQEISDDAMSLELVYLTEAAKLLEARRDALEEVAKHRLQQGVALRHWGFEPGRGATVWTKTTGEIASLGAMFKLDLLKPPEPCTPLQAKDRGLPESMMRAYSKSVPGAIKLTRITGDKAKRIFTQTT